MYYGGLTVFRRRLFIEFANLRAGETLDSDRAALLADDLVAAHSFCDLRTFCGGGAVHPDRRGLAAQHWREGVDQIVTIIPVGAIKELFVQVYASVLLA